MNKAKRIILLLALVLAFSLTFAACDEGPKTRAPSKPVSLQAEEGDKRVKLTWEAPADMGTAAVSKYQVSYAETDAETAGEWTDIAASFPEFLATGLVNDTEYTFNVRAISNDGEGEAETITATPFKELPPLAKLSDDDAKVLSKVIEDFKTDINWKIEVVDTALVADTKKEYTLERTGQSSTFAAKNGNTYIAKAADGSWYSMVYDAQNNFSSYAAYASTAAAQKAFDDNAIKQVISPITGIANTEDTRVIQDTILGKKQYIFEFYRTTTKLLSVTSEVCIVTVYDNKIVKTEHSVTTSNANTGAVNDEVKSVKTIIRGHNSITMPAAWQDNVFGPDGWANTTKQLSTGLSRTAGENSRWNSDGDNGIYISAFSDAPNTFVYDKKGTFYFDSASINNDATLKTAWNAYRVYFLYKETEKMGTPLDLNSKNLYSQIMASPLSQIPELKDYMPLLAYIKNDDAAIKSQILGYMDGLMSSYFGVEVTESSKRTMILDFMGGASVTVRYGRARSFVYETGADDNRTANSVIIEYKDATGDMPGVITFAQKTILTNVAKAFDTATNWKYTQETNVNGTKSIKIVEKTGTAATFAGVVREGGINTFLAKNNDGNWYKFVKNGANDFTVSSKIKFTSAQAETELKKYYPVFEEQIKEFVFCDSSTYEKTTSESVATETFVFVDKGDGYQITYTVVVKNGVFVSYNKNEVIGEGSSKKTNTTEIKVEAITDIGIPADFAAYDAASQTGGPATTVDQLTRGINATIDDYGNWTTTPDDADALFRLQRYEEYSKYFKMTSTAGQFVFDETTLETAGFATMWTTYQISFYYFSAGIDLNDTGLNAKFLEYATSLGQAAAYSLLVNTIGTSDEVLREAALTGLIATQLVFKDMDNTAKKNAIKADLNGVTVTVIGGLVTEYTEKGGTPHAIIYNP